MRCNQVSIKIQRFGEFVPKNYPEDTQTIHVYCDDFTSVYAALSKAYALAINELSEYENIGARLNVFTNEFSKTKHNHGHIPKIPVTKRKYEEDINTEYTDSNLELCKDRIWIYENSEAILDVLRECTSSDMLSFKLKERFELDDYQIRKLEQIRFEMMTYSEYKKAKNKLEEYEAYKNKPDNFELRVKNKIEELEQQISYLEAYFILMKHSDEVLKLIMNCTNKRELKDMEVHLMKNFNLTKEQAAACKYFTLKDFSKEEQLKKRVLLQTAKESLAFYQDSYVNQPL